MVIPPFLKTRPSLWKVLCLYFTHSLLFAQEIPKPAVPAPSNPAPHSDGAQTWLENLQIKFRTAYEARVVQPFQTRLDEARTAYRDHLITNSAALKASGKTQDIVVLDSELDRFEKSSFQIPPDDSDTSSATIRNGRNQLRMQKLELEREWDAAAAKLRADFDTELVQTAKALVSQKIASESALLLSNRVKIGDALFEQLLARHQVVRGRFPAPPSQKNATAEKLLNQKGGLPQTNRKSVEESAAWILSIGGSISYRSNGNTQLLNDARHLPKGRVDIVSVELDGMKIARSFKAAELQKLAPLAVTESLSLRNLDLDLGDIAFLHGSKQLKSFEAYNMRLRNDLAASFEGCTALTAVTISNCSGLAPGFFEKLAHFAPSITGMYLGGTNLSGGVVSGIASLAHLKHLDISNCKVTDADFSALGLLRQLHYLEPVRRSRVF